MKHYCVILLCLVLFSNVERMSAREIEYQNVVDEILDGCQARVMRASPYKKLLHQYPGIQLLILHNYGAPVKY